MALIGNLNREGVNSAGLVPSALVGMALIALGSFALLSAYFARTGRSPSLLVPAALALLVVGAERTLLIDQAQPSEYASGLRGLSGYLVVAGDLVCYLTVILTLSWAMMVAAMYTLYVVGRPTGSPSPARTRSID